MYTIICGILQECGEFTWGVSDCEELVEGDKNTAPLYSTSKNKVEQHKPC